MCMPGQLECPAHQMKGNRTIRSVDGLIKEKASTTANLIRAEIIGVVLYTGPMVVSSIVYWNAITVPCRAAEALQLQFGSRQ